MIASRSQAPRRIATIVTLGAVIVGLVGTSADAKQPLPITCTAAAQVAQTPGPGNLDYGWSVSGQGSCQGNGKGTYAAQIVGVGTSKTLGYCSGSAFVQNLDIAMTVTLTNVSSGKVTTLSQNWGAPVTTFPVAVPFLIRDKGIVGAGVIFNHLFVQCPPGGSPAAQITWTQGSPN